MIFDKKKKKPRKPMCVWLLALLLLPTLAKADDPFPLNADTYVTGCHLPGSCAVAMASTGTTTSTTNVITINGDANRKFIFGAASDASMSLKFGDGGTTAGQTLSIIGSTADADDDSQLCVAAGGACQSTGRSGYFNSYGNEVASVGGGIQVIGGNATTGHVDIGVGNASALVRVLNASSTPVASYDNNGTLAFIQTGSYVQMAAYVPTMVATPVLGTNNVLPGMNVIPTAAANTAAFLGAATPVAGQQFKIYNNSGAAVRIVGTGAATINGGTAGKYIAMAASSYMECLTVSSAILQCPFYSVNGAVAAVPTPA